MAPHSERKKKSLGGFYVHGRDNFWLVYKSLTHRDFLTGPISKSTPLIDIVSSRFAVQDASSICS